MRRAAKVDKNQSEIVEALRAKGWTVQVLSDVGRGCPDILVGARGMNVLLEIKDGAKPEACQRLTQDQEKWHLEWNGQVAVVNSVNGAIDSVLHFIEQAEWWGDTIPDIRTPQ